MEKECAKILALMGIKDVWSKTFGQTGTKFNLLYACINALKKSMEMKINENSKKEIGIVEGAI